MNTEQQRIAIAEACGWTECRLIKSYDGKQVPYGVAPNESPILKETPDYPNDLNAMHEAEEKLKLDQHRDYHDHLQKFCRYPEFCNAAQRAEAFLKTLDLWEN
jgi:hypothetical protein